MAANEIQGVSVCLLLLVGVWSSFVNSQQECFSQIECGDCISQPGCAWCAERMDDAQGALFGSRCQPAANFTTPCSSSFVENPQSTLGMEFRNEGEGATIDFQRLELNLRVGSPLSFNVTVTPQPNLPLDLYILIDLSGSMSEELRTVQVIASQIADRVRNVTDNVRLGFGSFVEKPTQPFSQENILGELVSDVYAFRHVVNMTDNSTEFAAALTELNVASNIDIPENGLSGLAQAITCQDIIGWRPRVDGIGTRLVLFMTDEEYHFAGEGRLAGIVRPYDGTCLLQQNSNGGPVEYTRSLEYDYPSVGQILELLQRNGVVTIFAVQSDHTASYQAMADTILNADGQVRAAVESFIISTVNPQAALDAQNSILDIIARQYERILQAVSLDTTSITSDPTLDVSVDVRTTCPPSSTVAGLGCSSVPLRSPVNFEVTVTLNSCEGLQDQQIFRRAISTSSFGSFQVDIQVTCNCQCARERLNDPPSRECMNMGVRRCGVCECDAGRCGANCGLSIGNRSATDCPRGGVDSLVCSGRGECDCICRCDLRDNNQMIFGDACECDNFRCPAGDNGTVCSGRGRCCEGQCMCFMTEDGIYRGMEGAINICECEPLERVCVDPDNDTDICNGRGTCGCDFCMCSDPNFTGMFCNLPNVESCEYQADIDCIERCRDQFSDNLPNICTECNLNRPVLFVSSAEVDQTLILTTALEEITTERLGGDRWTFVRGACEYTNEDNCQAEYYILTNQTNFAIVAVSELDCSTSLNLLVPVWALAPIILGCLLILGILIVILIKIIFTILDYVDFKRWQKDAQGADFGKNTNPLYQSPEMKYENVAYGKE